MASEDDNPGKSFEGDFQLNFDEQQSKISSLKELVRQTEINHGKNSAAQEKVKNIAQRLSQLKNKVSSKRYESSDDCEPEVAIRHQSVPSTPIMSRARSETPGSEKIQLLRAQMEQNRQKMAEREGSKKGIEEMVIQLKAKFDSTQLSLEKSSKLGKSIGDLSQFSAELNRSRYKSQTDVSSISSNLDKEKIKLLEMKIKELEKQVLDKKMSTDDYKNKILDLEENLKEKECIIDARTQAVSLMSENLSMKGKNTIDLLEETKKEMIEMQNNFIKVENELKDEISEKSGVIENLKQQNTILEDSRYNLTVDNSKLQELQEANKRLEERLNTNTEILLNTELETFLEENSIPYENLVESLRKIIESSNENLEKLSEKTIEYNVLNANFVVLEEKLKCLAPKSLFSLSSSDDDSEIMKLKQQMEDSNKSLIKTKLKIKQLEKEVDSFKKKSESLFNENQTLQQRLAEEKLVSSNESIEIVEGLTQEEKLEMEESLKAKPVEEELGLSDSLVKLREESSELMEKVELFTYERKEVLAKMESLTNENEILQGNYDKLEEEKNQLAQLLKDSTEKEVPSTFNKEIYVTALTNLENEMENFRKTKDKNNKLRLMKKVNQEGKIVHDLLNSLLIEHSSVLERSSEVLSTPAVNEELIKCKEDLSTLERKQISTNEQITILNTLLAEQKQQLIEAFQTHELQVEEYENRLKTMNDEITELKEIGERPDFSIELKNKQDTIDELNNQIIELYKTLEATSNQLLEKDDEIVYMKEVVDSHRDLNKREVEKLNNQIKKNEEIISQLESQSSSSSSSEEVVNLTQKNKEQLDKLKKFAANLKKKVAQCNELELKLAEESERYSNSLRELNEEKEKLEEQIKKMENEPRTQSTELESMFDEEREKYTNSLRELNEEKTKLEERFKLMQDEPAEFETKLAEEREKYSHSLRELNEENEKLSTQCTELENKLTEESEKYTYSLRELNEEKEKLSTQCIELETKLAEESEKYTNSLRELNEEKENLEEQIKKMQDEPKSNETDEIKQALIDKTNECIHLEECLSETDTRLTDEAWRLEEYRIASQNNIHSLESDLKARNIKIEKCKVMIKEKNKEIQRLSENLAQTTSQLSIETIKLQENLLYIETIETENNQFKEKISKLEEGISYAEERRLSLSKKANLLDEELLNKSNEYEQNEDMLVQRLTALNEKDDLIERKLNEKENENKDLKELLSTTTSQREEFMKKVATLEHQLEHVQSDQLETYEKENYLLNQEVQMLVKNSNKMTTDYEKRLQEKHSEIDELESELSSQIQQIEDEKKVLQINNEKLHETVASNVEEISRLKENVSTFEQLHADLERELQGLRMQIVEEQTEFENLRSQNNSEISAQIQEFDNLKFINEEQLEEIEYLKGKLKSSEKLINELRNDVSNLQSELSRAQFSGLESYQVGLNQTDDQVSIQLENERLKETIQKYEKELEDKKQVKNIESEVIAEVPSFNSSIFFNSPGTSSLFDAPVVVNSQEVELKKRIQELTDEVSFLRSSMTLKEENSRELELQKNIKELTEEVLFLKSSAVNNQEVEMKQKIQELTEEVNFLRSSGSSMLFDSPENDREVELKKKVQELTEKVNSLKNSGTSSLFEAPVEEVSFFKNSSIPLGTSSFFDSPIVENTRESELKKTIQELSGEVNLLRSSAAPVVEMKKQIEDLTAEVNFLRSSDMSREAQMSKQIEDLTAEVNFLKTSGTSLFFDSPAVQNSQEIEMKKKIEELTGEVNALKSSLVSKEDEIDFVKETVAEPFSSSRMFAASDDAVDLTFDPYAGREPVVEDAVMTKSAYVCGTKVDSKPEQIIAQLNQQIITESNNYQNTIENLTSSNKFFESRILELEDSLIRNQEEIGTREEIINQLKSSFMKSETKLDELNDHLLRSQQIELHEIEKRENMIESLDSSNKQLENRILELEQSLQRSNHSCQQLEAKLLESEKKPAGISSFFETEVSKDNIFDSFNPSTVEKDQLIELQNKNTELKERISALEKEIQEKIVIEDSPWEIQESSEIALERDRLKDEIQSYQLKYAKILKKLKEYKQKIEKLESVPTTTNICNDLDKAIEEELHSQVKQLEEKLDEMKNDAKTHLLEKEKLTKRIDVLTAGNDRMTNMKEKQDLELQNYQMKVNQLNSKLQQLEDWDDSPSHDNSNFDELKKQINDLKTTNAELEERLTESNDKQLISKIEELTHQISDLKISLTNLTEEYNGKVTEINSLTEKQSELLNEIERMKTASLFQGPEFSVNPSPNQSISSDNRIEEISSELQYKESEILHLNQKIQDMQREDQTQSLVQEILNKNFEIKDLKKNIQELTNDKTELENNLSLQLSQQMLPIKNEQVNVLSQTVLEKEQEINELKSENDSMLLELNALNEQVISSLENEDKLKSVLLEIDMKNIEISELKSAINLMKSEADPNITVVAEEVLPEPDSSEIVHKIREALESQELEIVTLKEQLAIRSAELARLDPYGEKSLSSIDLKAFNGSVAAVDNSQSVPRSKLDLALYMLHQRDMRCEELTLELIGLLEERDSLQIKLSNSIRQIEEIKNESSPDASPSSPAGSINLQTKLSELQGVSHAKDKTLREQSDRRQFERNFMENDFSNIPEEAANKLIGANFNTMRESQSQSSVLFNWLLGKSNQGPNS